MNFFIFFYFNLAWYYKFLPLNGWSIICILILNILFWHTLISIYVQCVNKKLTICVCISWLMASGLVMTHNSSTLILTKNLAFVTNADEPESIEIKFEVIKAPQFGVLQRLRSDSAGNNGEWQNAQHFTSFQLAREQIRYLHTSGGPTHDEFKVSNIYTPLAACRSQPRTDLFLRSSFFPSIITWSRPPAHIPASPQWVEKKRDSTGSGTAATALCFNLRVEREGILENIQMLFMPDLCLVWSFFQ